MSKELSPTKEELTPQSSGGEEKDLNLFLEKSGLTKDEL